MNHRCTMVIYNPCLAAVHRYRSLQIFTHLDLHSQGRRVNVRINRRSGFRSSGSRGGHNDRSRRFAPRRTPASDAHLAATLSSLGVFCQSATDSLRKLRRPAHFGGWRRRQLWRLFQRSRMLRELQRRLRRIVLELLAERLHQYGKQWFGNDRHGRWNLRQLYGRRRPELRQLRSGRFRWRRKRRRRL